ncbi:amino acid permease [Candidatus Omnitrophota bacterium]
MADQQSSQNNTAELQAKKLNAFSGVFTPSILTIFGIIMFLRFGYVVGNAGLREGTLIVLIAVAIAALTGLSLVAIVSNMRVKGGGLYYLISRSLGMEFGAACGIVLYFAMAVSVAFYIIGFAEIFCSVLPQFAPYQKFIASIVCLLLFYCVYRGVDWATKLQFVIMALLFSAVIVFLWGGFSHFNAQFLKENLSSAYRPGENFWLIFALFFPAITGFTQGVAMSGDLQRPEKDIPKGVFASLFLSAIVYLVLIWLLGSSASREALQTRYLIAKEISPIPFLIDIGIFAGTLSSALASFLGAPRILQAISKDKIFPFLQPFSQGFGMMSEPRRATYLTLGIALVAIVCTDLNNIAPVVTMFFLISYGLMNYATFYEGYSKTPSFRPRFKFFHWRFSLVGTFGCAIAMFAIDLKASLVALLVIFLLYQYTERYVDKVGWGDAKRGFYFRKIKDYLYKLRNEPFHSKSWRPQILVFCGRPENRLPLVLFGRWFEAGRGFFTLAHIIVGELQERLQIRANEEKSLKEFIERENLDVFGEVVISPDYMTGFQMLIQAHGVTGLKPNTVLLGWSDQKENRSTYVELLRSIEKLHCNLIVINENKQFIENRYLSGDFAPGGALIDVWWRGQRNGGMMLLLAYLLTQNREWSSARIRLIRLVDNKEDIEPARKHLIELAENARIICEPVVIQSDRSPKEEIVAYSKESAMTFLGVSLPEDEQDERFLEYYSHYIDNLENVALVLSVEDIEL